MPEIVPQKLTSAAFAPFGEVIAADGPEAVTANQGTAQRLEDLARIDVGSEGGRTAVSIYHSQARSLPLTVEIMERHPLGSQLFMPLGDYPYLVVVAPAGDTPNPSDIRAFLARGSEGVNYKKGTWHLPLCVLDADGRFLCIDRAGEGDNVEEHWFAEDTKPVILATGGFRKGG